MQIYVFFFLHKNRLHIKIHFDHETSIGFFRIRTDILTSSSSVLALCLAAYRHVYLIHIIIQYNTEVYT